LGNQLIKRVVSELRRDLPMINKFSTLSPMNGFAQWLNKELTTHNQRNLMSTAVISYCNRAILSRSTDAGIAETCDSLKQLLSTRENAMSNEQTWKALEPFLIHMAAIYLCQEKHRGYALNTVANFHLHNGACVWRINFDGDSSARGWTTSYGLMAHYRYNMDRVSGNTEQYVRDRRIDIGYKVQNVLDFAQLIRDWQ